MALRAVVRVAAGALLATLAAGCGSATSSTSTSRPPAAMHRSSSAAAPSAIPPGFARYRGAGFSFVAPAGLKPAHNDVSGLPAGASVTFLTPGGESIQRANTEIIEGVNPHLRFDIDEVVANLRGADSANPALKHVSTNVGAATVDGAEAARVVSESYIGPRPTTLYRRTWLMVSPRPGVLLDLVVAVEPWRGGTLNPATVLSSFRLTS